MTHPKLPVDIVLAPEWWHRHEGVTFDRDYFFHPARRVEVERQMERALYERWGRYGLGADRGAARPEVGAVHLAAGYLLSEMLGCEVLYDEAHPPTVRCAERDSIEIDPDAAFRSPAFRAFEALCERLSERYGALSGDVNWGGVLNIALDLRGEAFLMDLLTDPESASAALGAIAEVIDRFTEGVEAWTGSSSISINRNVRHLPEAVFLHSECSHTMLSVQDYERYLLPFDIAWSRRRRPFGIHYCGTDPHRFAASYAKIPHLDLLDVGWGGDVAVLREHLPRTFLNIRLSPVEIAHQSAEEIRATVRRLVAASGDLERTGICCINMDDTVGDAPISALFEAVEELRRESA